VFFFFHEHFQRFFTQIHARVQPWWFFFAVVTVGSLPWTSLLPAALVRTWRSTRADRVPSIQLYPLLFLAIWAIVIVIFFSFSQSKLAPYILPAMPALALLTAKYVAESSPRKILPHFVGVAVLYAILFAIAWFIDPPHSQHFSVAELASLLHFVRTAFGIALLGALASVAFLYRNRLMFSLLAVGTTSFLCIGVLLIGADDLSELRSGYDLAMIAGPYAKLNKPIYSLIGYDQSLTFYLRHPVKLVGYRGELDFGLNQEPTKWIGSEAEFELKWKNDLPGSIALLPHNVYANLAAQGMPMTVIGSEQDEVVVTKP
jgi:4-amino-4-deoxy-L-arabinose transferase-like glycosyltransferase